MNRVDMARLAVAIEALDPRVRFTPERVTGWQVILDDVPVDLAQGSVVEHYRCSPYPITPADLRRRAAANAGLLAPPEAVAFAHAVRVAQAVGEGRASLHPAIRDAYDTVGGARGPLRDGGSTARAQFRDTYRQVAEVADMEVLAGRIPRMTPMVEPARAVIES